MEWSNPANAGNREAGAITQPSIRPIDSLLFWLIANNAVSLSQLTQADFPTKIQCDDGGFFFIVGLCFGRVHEKCHFRKKKKKILLQILSGCEALESFHSQNSFFNPICIVN